jgi:hypothetical protein
LIRDAFGHEALDLRVAPFEGGTEQGQCNGRDNAEDKGTDHGSCQTEVPADDGSHRGGTPAGDDLGGAQAEAVPSLRGLNGWSFSVAVVSFGHLFQLCPCSQFGFNGFAYFQMGV